MSRPDPRGTPLPGRLRRGREAAIAGTFARGFEALARLGGLTPLAHPARYGAERERNLRYGPGPAQRLDLYRPTGASGPRPVVLYLHGGGFRAMSKDTHWLMGLRFARQGYLVANADYRLAPRHPYPAAIEDAALALEWVAAHAAAQGGDLGALVLAGESAGANLALALTVACCWPRPEPWARRLWALGLRPRVCLPACGILEVSDPERFNRRKALPFFVRDALRDPASVYLRGASANSELADPLVVLERAGPPERPLPAFFLPVGTADPLVDDTRRAHRALLRLGADAEARYYPGEVHAFHALVWRAAARQCWDEMLGFTEARLGAGTTPAV